MGMIDSGLFFVSNVFLYVLKPITIIIPISIIGVNILMILFSIINVKLVIKFKF